MSQSGVVRKVNLLLTSTLRAFVHHVKLHVGVGIVCSVAYFDPGNWSVDLQAGSSFGYRPMLFVVLMSGIGAIILQTLAYRLGCVTGTDLASHCRSLLYNHPKHPKLVRRAVLYPLYLLSEIAIVSTDLAELLGSAIGICLLIPQLPLWAGVLLTATDVFVFLLLSNPTQKKPARMFEAVIITLVFAVFACFVVLLVKVRPDWPQVFKGYIPSKTLFQSEPDAIYTAVGILGATVMPHALFLGSFLAMQDRVSLTSSSSLVLPTSIQGSSFKAKVKVFFGNLVRSERVAESRDNQERNSTVFINEHLRHGIIDVVTSLLLIAVPINSAILVVAATVFFDRSDSGTPAGLFDAHGLIQDHIGNGAGVLFAVALICAGQTAGITATLAGQVVSEGFIQWTVSPFLRRSITRLISLVPSVVVAVAVGRDGINTLLVASQVALSIVLPFIAFPLIYLTSSSTLMRVRKPTPLPSVISQRMAERSSIQVYAEESLADLSSTESTEVTPAQAVEDKNEIDTSSFVNEDYIDFSNGRILTIVSYIMGSIVLAANVYAIVMLGLGRENPPKTQMNLN